MRSYFIPAPWLVAFVALIVLIMPSLAFAQDGGTTVADGLNLDFSAIFTSTAALAAFSIILVGFLREKVWKTLDGATLTGVVFIVNLAVAVIGFYAHLLKSAADLYGALGFGIGAGIIAIGTVSTAYKIAAKGQTPQLPPSSTTGSTPGA